jgi:transglutaminase-like putative cysteine protease
VGSEARTRIGLWALIGITLFSFSQVFEADEYVGPALLGAILASVLCMAARRIGMSTLFALISSAVGLVIYVTFVFGVRTTVYGVPTSRTVDRIWSGLLDAWRQSQIDYSPIPSRTGYVMLMVIGFWIVASLGETATFRWRLPVVASAGPIAMFCLALVVGTGQGSPVLVAMFLAALLAYWALESSHRVRSWGRWVTPWAHQTDAQPESGTAGLARRMGYSTVAAALIAPFFLPAIGSGLLSWRSGNGGGPGDGGGGSGSSETSTVDPWVQLNPSEVLQSTAEMMRVSAATASGEPGEAAYWRLVSLNHFEAGKWTTEGIGDSEIRSTGLDDSLPNDPGTLVQNISIKGLRGASLPAAVDPVSIRMDNSVAADTVTRDDTGSLKVPNGLRGDLTYKVVSVTPDRSFEALRDAETGGVDGSYLDVPPLSPEVQALTRRWVRNADTDLEELVALQTRLRGFRYDLNVPPPTTGDYLTEFLTDTRSGYCQQFATAFTLQARFLGHPTRVSVGFLPGDSEQAGEFVVHGTDAHAWPEVYFGDQIGWVRFEPTPRSDGAAVIVPDYTEDVLPTGGNGPGQPELQPGKNGPLGERLPQPLDVAPAEPTEPVAAPAPSQSQWQRTFSMLIRIVAIGLLIFLALVPLLKELRTRRRYRNAAGGRALADAAFAHFEEEAADLATPRRPAESAQTFAERLAGHGQVPDRTALRLAQIYDAAVFAPRDLDNAQGAEAKELAGQLRHELWARASWWTRVGRLFSPRSLWAGS